MHHIPLALCIPYTILSVKNIDQSYRAKLVRIMNVDYLSLLGVGSTLVYSVMVHLLSGKHRRLAVEVGGWASYSVVLQTEILLQILKTRTIIVSEKYIAL